MKFGTLYSYWGREWSCNYEQVAKKVADVGFDVIEVGADHLYHMSDVELRQLKDVMNGYGLMVTTNSGPAKQYDFASADATTRERGQQYFRSILEKMDTIGSKSLVGAIYSFWPSDFVETNKAMAWERSIPELKKLGAIAEDLDIECALEVLNRNETYILTSCKEAIEYCNQIGSKNINILLDTYHMNIEEDNMIEAIHTADQMLGHFHVGENNRKLPGMNNSLPWNEIGKALRDIHYKKAVVMEPFLLEGGAVGRDIRVWRDLSDGANGQLMDQYITESLKFLKKSFLD